MIKLIQQQRGTKRAQSQPISELLVGGGGPPKNTCVWGGGEKNGRAGEDIAFKALLSQPPPVLPSVLPCGVGGVLIKLIILRGGGSEGKKERGGNRNR